MSGDCDSSGLGLASTYSKSEEETRLAHTRIADKQQLEQIVAEKRERELGFLPLAIGQRDCPLTILDSWFSVLKS